MYYDRLIVMDIKKMNENFLWIFILFVRTDPSVHRIRGRPNRPKCLQTQYRVQLRYRDPPSQYRIYNRIPNIPISPFTFPPISYYFFESIDLI